jgi:hypothetical protein
VTRVAAVVGDLGLLHDDAAAAICAWLGRRAGELPAGFRRDVHDWLLVLLDGDARTRPRSDTTIRVYFGAVWPLIECWAATRGHLREITSRDVDAVLKPLRGHRHITPYPRCARCFGSRNDVAWSSPTPLVTLPMAAKSSASCCR